MGTEKALQQIGARFVVPAQPGQGQVQAVGMVCGQDWDGVWSSSIP